MPTEQQILSEEQLVILDRAALVMAQRVCHTRFCDPHPLGQAEVCKATTEGIEQFDALCHTVRGMQEKVTICERAFELDDALKLSEVGNLNALQVMKKLHSLAARLKEVEAERDRWKNRADYLARKGQDARDFRTRIISLCNERAAEWREQSALPYTLQSKRLSLIAMAIGVDELRQAIENLEIATTEKKEKQC